MLEAVVFVQVIKPSEENMRFVILGYTKIN